MDEERRPGWLEKECIAASLLIVSLVSIIIIVSVTYSGVHVNCECNASTCRLCY